MPSLLRTLGSHNKLMSQLLLNKSEVALGVPDVVVLAEVWHEVVDVVAELLHFVLVLGAAGRRANWIRFCLNI